MTKKIVVGVIGGGSLFTPELIKLLAENTDETGSVEVKLMDIDKERLQIVGSFCERIVKKINYPLTISYVDTYEDAIKGSDYVLLQFRVGGEQSRIDDDRLGMKYKIPFVETVTVCGLGSFLRTYYQVEIIAELVKKHAPDAWVMNFANPSGVLTEALHKLGCNKVVGVCNGSLSLINGLAEKLSVNHNELFINWRGLNHLTIVDGIFYEGENVYKKVIAQLSDDGDDLIPFPKRIIESVGFTPNSYMRYNYLREYMVDKLQKEGKTRAETVREVNAELLEMYKDEALDSPPEELIKRGGYGYSRSVADLIKGLSTGNQSVHYVQIRNGSIFRELPPDAFVEVPALALENKLRALQIEEFPSMVKPLIMTMKTYEQLLIEAAMSRSKCKIYNAMLVNPLFGSDCVARPILDELLSVNNDFLPEIS